MRKNNHLHVKPLTCPEYLLSFLIPLRIVLSKMLAFVFKSFAFSCWEVGVQEGKDFLLYVASY